MPLPPDAWPLSSDLASPTPPRLPSPFDEPPRHPAARWAVEDLRRRLATDGIGAGLPADALATDKGGTMLGVLVVRASDDDVGYLRAFSGFVAGRAAVPGWVGPMFDPDAYDRVRAAGEARIAELEARRDAEGIEARAAAAARDRDQARAADADARAALKADLRTLQAERRSDDADRGAQARASQFQNARAAELRRAWRARLAEIEARTKAVLRRRDAYRRLHRALCEALLRDVHALYTVPGPGPATLAEVFAPKRPPGGTGDCAGAKLIAAARREGLAPIALAETWYGPPPPGGGRLDGALYPACRAKCGPLMAAMLSDLEMAEPVRLGATADARPLTVLHEDARFLAVDKPPGLLSVPGRTRSDSALTRLQARFPQEDLRSIHRLDQDASGVLLFAKGHDAQRWAQAEFAGRRVDKRYRAILDGEVAADEGTIRLAFRLDPEDRPRQVLDPEHGKWGTTRFRVVARRDGRTEVLLWPETGRTHQLRCHAAHAAGLDAPIVGDPLYGRPGPRLLLHAEHLALAGPDGDRIEARSPADFTTRE